MLYYIYKFICIQKGGENDKSNGIQAAKRI